MKKIFNFLKKDKEIEEKYIDKITGVFNKEYLSIIEKEFYKLNAAFILIDIDNFGEIYKNYGKDICDLLLQDIVKIIKSNVRENDIIIRTGEDEFLILVNKDENISSPLSVAERIINKLSINKFFIITSTIKLTASAGVYLTPEKDSNLSDALKKVDMALMQAKQKKNSVEIYNISRTQFLNKRILEIKEAINDNRIICYYQPIFDFNTMKTVKYEALVRMLTPERKIVLPNLFITSIINSHIYKELTKKIIIFNASFIKSKNIDVSINLLPSDILDMDIFNLLYSLPKEIKTKITVELLESENVNNYEILRENLNKLRNEGIKIAIDDFGSGFSNILHLIELNFDYIKIDGQIVKKVDEDIVSYKAIKAINAMAKEINLKVIAEFVSSESIFNKLKEIGIDYGQGYFFKEPLHPSMIK